MKEFIRIIVPDHIFSHDEFCLTAQKSLRMIFLSEPWMD